MTTTTTTTMTASTAAASVSFDTSVCVRTYEVILGDHPRCCSVKRGGFPLTLGWNYMEDTKQIITTTTRDDDDEDNNDDSTTTFSNSNADAGAGPDLSLSNTKKRSTLERLKLSVEDRKQRLMNVNDWSEEYLFYQEHQRLRRLKVEDGIHKHSQIYKLNTEERSSARPFRRQSFLRHRDSLSHVTSNNEPSDVADIILRQRERQQRRRSSEDGTTTTTTTMSDKQSSSSPMQQQSPRSVATVLEAETTSSLHSSSSSSSSSSYDNNSTSLRSSSVASVVPVVPQTPQLMSLLY